MNPKLKKAIESAVGHNTQSECLIVASSPVSGGCINSAAMIELADGRKFFVKSNSRCPQDLFLSEAQGLMAIEVTKAIKVPEVICTGSSHDAYFLVLEWIESTRKQKRFFELLGQELAQMHQSEAVNKDHQFGFFDDNFVGSTDQVNTWNSNWCEFYRDQRLGFQFELAKQRGHNERSFEKLADNLLAKLPELLNGDEKPALIHGDLWSGNYLVGQSGEPVLIDPAVYLAHREAEFGMTTLFGGFSSEFYSAYEEALPFADGADERIAIYRLYHLLNHLNLFGSSYMSGCVEIMRRFA